MAHNNESIKNNLNPRALEYIYLRSSNTLHHKHQLYHIPTKCIITCRTCTSAKIPDHMLSLLEEQVTMPSGIDFNHKIDDNLFAGVGDNTNIVMNKNNQDEIHMDTIQIQDELYEPSPFLTPSTKNDLIENTQTELAEGNTQNDIEIQANDLLPFHDEYPLHNIEDMENMFNNTEEEIVFKEKRNKSTEQPAYDTHKSLLNIHNINTDANKGDNITDEVDTEENSIKPMT